MVIAFVALGLCAGLAITGCGPRKAASTSEAYQTAGKLKTAQEKANYLVHQARAFYNSKQYMETVELAQYILAKLDKNSAAANDLLARARKQIDVTVKAAAHVENALGNLGK